MKTGLSETESLLGVVGPMLRGLIFWWDNTETSFSLDEAHALGSIICVARGVEEDIQQSFEEIDKFRAELTQTRALLALARQDEDLEDICTMAYRLQQPGFIVAMDALDRLYGDVRPHGNTMWGRVKQALEEIESLRAAAEDKT